MDLTSLRNAIRSPEVQRQPEVFFECVQSIFAATVRGVDASSLLHDMIKASETPNLRQRKLVYAYLCQIQPSSETIHIINTLQKQCCDSDERARALALNSLCTVACGEYVDCVLPSLVQCLRDRSAFVRQIAVLNCIKVSESNMQSVLEANLFDRIIFLLDDRDALVSSNAMLALQQMQSSKIVMTKDIVNNLLEKLRTTTEWSQQSMLSIISQFKPQDDDHALHILNMIDDRLSHRNIGVVIAAAKLFLIYIKSIPSIRDDVLLRIRDSLLVFVNHNCPEIIIVAIHNISVLLRENPLILENEWKLLLFQEVDRNDVIIAKSQIFSLIINDNNAKQIISNISTIISQSRDEKVLKALASLLVDCTIIVPSLNQDVITMFISYIEFGTTDLAEAILQPLLKLLRNNNSVILSNSVVTLIAKTAQVLKSQESLLACLWIVGNFNKDCDEIVNVIEYALNSLTKLNSLVQILLISSCFRLVLVRPLEIRPLLKKLLQFVLVEGKVHPSVKYHARILYNLLSTSLDELQKFLDLQVPPVTLVEQHQFELKELEV